MCIIVAKEKGVKLPSKSILKECFDNNSDGAGMMYVQNGKVVIDKGYMNFKDFYKRIQKLKHRFNSDLKDKAIVFHFRIGTSGENDKATTHPFPISNNESDLKKIYLKTDLGMVHNGIISQYTYDKKLSDTQTFIRDFVSVFKDLNKKFFLNESVMNLLEKEASSKLCFLDNKENIYYVGDFVEDKGVKYSNNSYKEDIYSYKYYTRVYNYNTPYSKSTYDKDLVEEFIDKRIDYEILKEGDFFECDSYSDYVSKYDTLIVDSDYNLYELVKPLDEETDNAYISLVGINTIVYNSNGMLKRFYWESYI